MSRRSALVTRVLRVVATSPGSGSLARTRPAVLVESGALPCRRAGPAVHHVRGLGAGRVVPGVHGEARRSALSPSHCGCPSPPRCVYVTGVRELGPGPDRQRSSRDLGPPLWESQSGSAHAHPGGRSVLSLCGCPSPPGYVDEVGVRALILGRPGSICPVRALPC